MIILSLELWAFPSGVNLPSSPYDMQHWHLIRNAANGFLESSGAAGCGARAAGRQKLEIFRETGKTGKTGKTGNFCRIFVGFPEGFWAEFFEFFEFFQFFQFLGKFPVSGFPGRSPADGRKLNVEMSDSLFGNWTCLELVEIEIKNGSLWMRKNRLFPKEESRFRGHILTPYWKIYDLSWKLAKLTIKQIPGTGRLVK